MTLNFQTHLTYDCYSLPAAFLIISLTWNHIKDNNKRYIRKRNYARYEINKDNFVIKKQFWMFFKRDCKIHK